MRGFLSLRIGHPQSQGEVLNTRSMHGAVLRSDTELYRAPHQFLPRISKSARWKCVASASRSPTVYSRSCPTQRHCPNIADMADSWCGREGAIRLSAFSTFGTSMSPGLQVEDRHAGVKRSPRRMVQVLRRMITTDRRTLRS
jgi:hypothetical protein